MREEGMRSGDIESLRRKMKDEGRPIKSSIIRESNGGKTHYSTDKKGRVEIIEKES